MSADDVQFESSDGAFARSSDRVLVRRSSRNPEIELVSLSVPPETSYDVIP